MWPSDRLFQVPESFVGNTDKKKQILSSFGRLSHRKSQEQCYRRTEDVVPTNEQKQWNGNENSENNGITMKNKKTIYKTLTYGGEVYNNTSDTNMKRLKFLQNKCLRMITDHDRRKRGFSICIWF